MRDETTAQPRVGDPDRLLASARLRVSKQKRPTTNGVSAIREEMHEDEVSPTSEDHETTATDSPRTEDQMGSNSESDGFARYLRVDTRRG